jgi:hypothetical protein
VTYEQALKAVAQDWRNLAYDIRKEDAYASHVTELEKDIKLTEMLRQADDIKAGRVDSFTIRQRVQEKMTGSSVALLP